MVRKILKWTGIIVGTLIVLLLIGYAFIAANINQHFEKTYTFLAETLTIPNDSSTLRRGEHLAVIKGCEECHRTNLGGKVIMDDAGLGRLVANNLTKGQGGRPADYSTIDWAKRRVDTRSITTICPGK